MKIKRYIRRIGTAVVMALLTSGQALAQVPLKSLLEHATVKWYANQQKSAEITSVTLSQSSSLTLYLELTPEDGYWTDATLLGGQVRMIAKNSAADARTRSGETTGPVIGVPAEVTAVSGQTYHKYGGGLYQVTVPALKSDQNPDEIARLELTGEMTACRTITPSVTNTTMTVKIDGGDVTYAKPGEQIDVTISTSVEGYMFNHFTVTYPQGLSSVEVPVTTISEGRRSFTMPDGDVTIDASYIAPRPYAVKSEDGTTLTFYYDGLATTGYDSNVISTWRTSEDSGWGAIKATLTTVIIDPALENCTSLTSLAYWFSGCTNLTEIQGLAYLKTENVTDMSHLFEGCEGFTKLYLTTFNTRQVTDMTAMFKGCTNLKRIFVDTNWSASQVTSSTDMFTGCTTIKGRKGTTYDANHTDAEYARPDTEEAPGYLMPNAKLYTIYTSSDKTLTFYYDGETRSGVRTEGDAFKNGVFDSMSDNSFTFNWGGSITTVLFDESMADCDEITSMSWWFANHESIQYVKGLEYLMLDKVTDIKYAFRYSTHLKEFDFSKFNTKGVKNMKCSFYRIGLPTADFSGFDTRNVEDMRGIFAWSGALKKIIIGGKFDTRNFVEGGADYTSWFRGVGCDTVQVRDASNHHISVNIFQEMADRTTRRLETDSPLPEGEVTLKDGYLWWKGAKFSSYNKYRSLKMGTPENGSLALTSATTYEGYGEEGQTLTFKATPNIGYELVSITLTYNDGTSKTVTASDTDDENTKTLVMLGYEAAVTATFQPIMKTLDPTKPCSKDNPYAIRTVEDMRNLSVWANAGAPFTSKAWFKIVTANAVFDFEGVDDFEPIGGEGHTFTSNFDGNGVTIKNLHITGTNRVGLFGDLNGNVSNIRIDASCSVTATGWYIGAIAGSTRSNTITNCHNDGANVSGQAFVGGLIGDDYYSNVSLIDCSVGMTMAEGTKMYISGKDSIAAMVGDARGTMRNNWYNGMTVVVKKTDGREYTGFGYARGEIFGDFEGLKSATGGEFPAVTPGHTQKTMSWSYNLYNKIMTVIGEADAGYDLTGVTISYVDAKGETQTISRNEAQLKESRSLEVPYHPTTCTATFYGVLRPADMTTAISQANPYLIHNVQDMVTLTKYTKAGVPWTSRSWFKVADENAVFDFEGVDDFEPIGGEGHTFTSNFDGNGVTIKNLHITGTNRVGLFGDLNGNVSNIRIDGSCSVTATGWYIGAIAGSTRSNTITNCHNDGANVSGQAFVGGLIGDDYYSNVSLIDCSVGMTMAEGTKMYISGKDSIAAMVGDARGTMRNNWYNGMTVVVKKTDGREYTGFGYARGEIFGDFDGLRSATQGYLPIEEGNLKKGLTWNYDLYHDTLTVSGTADEGYKLASVTATYLDDAGEKQTKISYEREFYLPSHPITITAAYGAPLEIADSLKPCSYDNPYLIRSVEDMILLSKATNAGVSWTKKNFFKVVPENAVFDFEGVTDFVPIGITNSGSGPEPPERLNGLSFHSSFDGNGVTIKNLHITGNSCVGLFGYVSADYEDAIENIIIDSSCSFTGKGNFTGSVVGGINFATIRNCKNMGAQVTGNYYVGGIAGHARYSTIENCLDLGSVKANSFVGGIVGYIDRPVTLKENKVGLGVDRNFEVIIEANERAGAVYAYNFRASTFIDNLYNGLTVTVKVGDKEYHKLGYGFGSPVSDIPGIRSITNGTCGELEWEYDPYTKELVLLGEGAMGTFEPSTFYTDVKGEIESLTIGEGVTAISNKAFEDWTSLHTVIFDGCKLTSAADNAFEGCKAMAEGKVIVKKRSPLSTDTASALFTVISNGTLLSDEFVDLTEELTEADGKFLWHGGTFASYEHYRRTLEGVTFSEDHHWTTYYAAEDLVIPEGLTAYVVDDFNGSTVSISAIDYIPAGVGILLYSEESGNNYTVDAYTGDKTVYTSLLTGSLKEISLASGGGYVLYRDEFVKVSEGILPAKRCYLPLAEGVVAAARLRILSDETTSISERSGRDTDEASWYDLNGRKLEGQPLRKGVYIHQGRKIVVK